jgi:hypothetical protein
MESVAEFHMCFYLVLDSKTSLVEANYCTCWVQKKHMKVDIRF